MPLLLRSTKYNKWIAAKPEWLREGEIPADPIFGLQTQSNTMSVWVIDRGTARIEQVISTLAAGKESLQDFEYVLLDSDAIADIGIKTFSTEGKSLNHELNKFHLELVEISAQKLLKLTETTLEKIWQGDTNVVDRIPRKTIAHYIFDSISKGRIDSANVNPKVLNKAQEVLGYSVNKIS